MTRPHSLVSVYSSCNNILLVLAAPYGTGNFFLIIQPMKIWCSRGLRATKVCPKALGMSLRRLSGHHLYLETGQVAWKELNSECMSMSCSQGLPVSPSSGWALEFHLAFSMCICVCVCICTYTLFTYSFKTNIPIVS